MDDSISDGSVDYGLERPPASIPWVRKRDGRVVPFEPTKLATSIFAARRRFAAENASLVAHEMAAATMHFLTETHGGTVPNTETIADTVVKVLTQTQQAETAHLYQEYRDLRAQQRSRVRLLEESRGAFGSPHRSTWDKSHLVQILSAGGGMDPSLAGEIAGDVEKKILQANLTVISASLIDEFLRCEMLSRGIPPSRVGSVSARQELQEAVRRCSHDHDVAPLVSWAGRRHLEQATLSSLYSPDVMGLVDDGLLELPGGGSAFHYSVSVTSRDVSREPDLRARLTRAVASSLQAVETHVEEWCLPGTEFGPSLHGLFRALASPAQGSESLFVLQCWDDALSEGSASTSAGELFVNGLPQARDSRWNALYTELSRAARAFPGLPDRLILDVPLLGDPHDTLPWESVDLVRAVALGYRVQFHHGRAATDSSGTQHRREAKSQVLQSIGVRLDRLAERVGGDAETFLERSAILAEAALRLGLQKREFMRSAGLVESGSVESIVISLLGMDRLQPLAGDELFAPSSIRFLTKTLHSLSRHVRRASRPYQVDARLDSPPGVPMFDVWARASLDAIPSDLDSLADLHSTAGGGTTQVILHRAGEWTTARSLVARWIAQRSPGRLLFARAPAPTQANLF